jgi:DNA gyrase subunit A
VLAIREFDESHFVFMATALGTVKKTPLSAFSRPRANGIIATSLEPSDCLVGVALTDGEREILLTTTDGKAIRFTEDQVRPMGREAAGVRGIRLGEGQRVTSLIVLGDGEVLTVSEHGYGKRTEVADFPKHGRAGQGVIALQTSERNGSLIGARQVRGDDEVMLINSSGTLVRVPASDIPVLGRNTQGVRIMRLEEGEKLVGLESIAGEDSQGGEGAG